MFDVLPRRLWLLLIVFNSFFSELVRSAEHKMHPEQLLNLTVKPCFYKDNLELLYPSDSLGALFKVKKAQFCISAFTDKKVTDMSTFTTLDDLAEVSHFVRFKWYELGGAFDRPSYCHMKFHGYRNVYRLSPDFGHYKECNSQISTYRHKVATTTDTLIDDSVFRFSLRPDCPISELPLNYANHAACELKENGWYLMEYLSRTQMEFRNRSTTTLVNNTFWVFPTYATYLHENSVADSVFVVKTVSSMCTLKTISYVKSNLPFDVTVELQAVITSENISVSQNVILNDTVHLNSSNQWQEVLYSFSTNSSWYGVELCYTGRAAVETTSKSVVIALVANGNHRICSYNRIQCSPPPMPVSSTNVNWTNWQLVVFTTIAFIVYDDLVFLSKTILN